MPTVLLSIVKNILIVVLSIVKNVINNGVHTLNFIL